jgi:predicted NAD-dependent protein-ADP-ribosyltransferase YbiA (DUF1768 family)
MNNLDQLYFYSKSKHCNAGKGAREIVANSSDYAALNKIKDWRKVLSNFHNCPFKYEANGYTYNTIEHCFQAQKIALVSKEKAFEFAMDSGSELSKGDGESARKLGLSPRRKRKWVVLSPSELTRWFKMSNEVMKQAAISKYAVSEEAREVLKHTGKAELWHLVPRSKEAIRFSHLERIRESL